MTWFHQVKLWWSMTKTHQGKPKNKGKACETPPEKVVSLETQIDIGLSGEEISNIMKAGNSPQACKENMAKFTQSHIMTKYKNNPTVEKPQSRPDPADMEMADEPTQQHLP